MDALALLLLALAFLAVAALLVARFAPWSGFTLRERRNSPLDPGASAVAYPAPNTPVGDKEPANVSVDHRVQELDELRAQSQITEDEYATRMRDMGVRGAGETDASRKPEAGLRR